MSRVRHWLRGFIPAPLTASPRERLYGCIGALLGLFCSEWVSRHALQGTNPWFIAPMGASAVLLFAVPASPLAQPWSVVGGNLVSAVIGVFCAQWIPDAGLAAGTAVALAIAAMFCLRCLHPPGGAVAITAVLGGPAVHALGYGFALWPVAVNSVLMMLMAVLVNNALRRRYPHGSTDTINPHHTRDPLPSQRLGFTHADLEQALAARGEMLDITREDLEEIFIETELRAYQRRLGKVLCSDIMSRDVVCVHAEASPEQAWQLLIRHRVHALPVVDGANCLAGIVSLHDFFTRPGQDAAADSLPIRRQHDFVWQIMTQVVITARPGQPIAELAGEFSNGDLHHLPVVDEARQVVGMVTQSDLVGALFRMRHEHENAAGSAS